MSDKFFLDTNVFVYANDKNEPVKRSIAMELIRDLTANGGGVISYQVLHEFFNVVLTKTPSKMRHEEVQQFLTAVFRQLETVPSSFVLVSEAIRIQERYRLSWYDSLIVAAAQQAGCKLLYSEDLQHGQQFGTVTIHNPFL